MAGVAASIVEHQVHGGARRSGGALPFGAVMATGAVSQLSGLAGVPPLRLPLLTLAVVIAAAAAGVGATSIARAWRGVSPATSRFGAFTVPVGLAVIAAGLVATPGRGFGMVAVVMAALAAGTTVVTTAAAAVALAGRRVVLADVNGVWFVGPAAFLAVAVAAAAIGARPGMPVWWDWAGLAAVAVGTVGYAALLVAAAVRVAVHGYVGAPAVAWWIVTGCGGLAALALGRVAAALPNPGPVPALRTAALVCGAIATAALIPVAAGSVRHLRHTPRRLGQAAWPPAFSTGVYALGCAELADMFRWPWAAVLARVVAVETLIVWAVIAGINVAVWLRGQRSGAR